MSVVVTGATGHLGRLTVEALLARGVATDQLVATGRRTEALADLAARGVAVRRADYDDPGSLAQAFAGADRLLLVSSSVLGERTRQHQNAITAAAAAGVALVAYTSILAAPTSRLVLAREHRETEEALGASGLPHVLLRNGWYIENYTDQLPALLERGVVGATRNGRFTPATRADYAEAAAAVLTGEGHAGAAYELGGEATTLAELAATISRSTGREVTTTDLSVEEYVDVLLGAGLPEPVARMVADNDRGIAEGELLAAGHDLEQLIGRPPTPLADAVAAAASRLHG
jgi:NAD(P)H dehydrogenase (quinone)